MPKAAKSLVIIYDMSEPSMECIWSQEIGAPRAAEVIYHEVEALENVESDVMSLGFVKTFAL
jgi:hypothetical protein